MVDALQQAVEREGGEIRTGVRVQEAGIRPGCSGDGDPEIAVFSSPSRRSLKPGKAKPLLFACVECRGTCLPCSFLESMLFMGIDPGVDSIGRFRRRVQRHNLRRANAAE